MLTHSPIPVPTLRRPKVKGERNLTEKPFRETLGWYRKGAA